MPEAVFSTGTSHTFEPIVLDDAVLRWYAPWGPTAWEDLLAGTTETLGPFISWPHLHDGAARGQHRLVGALAQRDVREGTGGKTTSSLGLH